MLSSDWGNTVPNLRALLVCLASVAATSATAQDQIDGKIAVELNSAQSGDNACTLSFLVTSGMASDVSKLVFEAVLFDADGQVNRLTLFDFAAVPQARPRVRQFALPGQTCDGLGRVLLNGVNTCEGDGLTPAACETGLITRSRTAIDLQG